MAGSNYYPIVSSSPPPLLPSSCPPVPQDGVSELDDLNIVGHLDDDSHESCQVERFDTPRELNEATATDDKEGHTNEPDEDLAVQSVDVGTEVADVGWQEQQREEELEEERSRFDPTTCEIFLDGQPNALFVIEGNGEDSRMVCLDRKEAVASHESIDYSRDGTQVVVADPQEDDGPAVLQGVVVDDDEFGDFDSFHGFGDSHIKADSSSVAVEARDESSSGVGEGTGLDGFTDFESVRFDAVEFASFDDASAFGRCFNLEGTRPASGSDDDVFGDFDCARTTDEATPMGDVICGFAQALSSAFPPSPSSRLSLEVGNEIERETNSKLAILDQLCDVDTTNALTYQWSSSHSSRRLVSALRIDAKNVLPGTGWSSLVPAFASTLTAAPLEPTKAPMVSGDIEDGSSSKQFNCVTSQDLSFIPQAQFDWSSSGLTNPLEDDTTSALLDLDFFLTNDAPNFDSPPPIDSFESELLNPGDRWQPDGLRRPPRPSRQQPSQIVRKILLDSAKRTTAAARSRPLGLSEEAEHILDSLPDLSFLRAKIFVENVQAKEEDEAAASVRRERGGGEANGAAKVVLPLRGTKRKLEEEEEKAAVEGGGAKAYLVERQSVFNVFMCKLHRYRQVADPSLRRSVLICNTLRSIEREMVNEGMEPDAMGSSSVPFVPSAETDNMALDDPLPPPESPTFAAMLPLEPRAGCNCDPYEKSLTNSGRPERAATPFPVSDGSSLDDSSEAERSLSPPSDECSEERLPGINWSSVLNFSNEGDVDCTGIRPASEDAWNCEGGDGGRDRSTQDVGGGPNTSPSSSSDSGISTASDEIFGDIDLSLYDFDLLPLSPPNARVAPPSVEELLRSFPGEQTMVLPPTAARQQPGFARAEQMDCFSRVKVNVLDRL